MTTEDKQTNPALASCEECGAPMDDKQRYCISCGSRRKDTGGPAVQYFAGAARSKRRGAAARRPGAQSTGGRAAAVIFFVLLPIAVAVGVLVGRGGGEDNSELIAAIEAAGAGGGTGGGTLASQGAGTIASTYTLDKGYTVMLKTLPASGTDQAAVDAEIGEAEGQGAADVGIINPADFTTKPDQGGDYILYSGEFKSEAEADKALGKLRAKFKDAVVIEVSRAAASGSGGKVLAQTPYGSVSQVEGFEATPEKVASDAKVVEDIANKIGDDFVGAQKNLPDVIVVGGDGGGGSGADGTGQLMASLKQMRKPNLKLSSVRPRIRRVGAGEGAKARAKAKPTVQPEVEAEARELIVARDRLLERFTIMQADLGGAFYEMAIRDHVKLDVLTRKAAELQRVDVELQEVEERLQAMRAGIGSACPSCGDDVGAADAFCSSCGHGLSDESPK